MVALLASLSGLRINGSSHIRKLVLIIVLELIAPIYNCEYSHFKLITCYFLPPFVHTEVHPEVELKRRTMYLQFIYNQGVG